MNDPNTKHLAIDESEAPFFCARADDEGAPTKPTLTIAMDVGSRAIVGWHVAVDGAATT